MKVQLHGVKVPPVTVYLMQVHVVGCSEVIV